jgi:hypothetical protein
VEGAGAVIFFKYTKAPKITSNEIPLRILFFLIILYIQKPRCLKNPS